ncbi:MAG: FkbM family methyltransferase [Pseudolabrys sp.]
MSRSHLSPEQEHGLVRAFFGERAGYFVDVGANDPKRESQTWHLEQAGWTGVLIEPQPDLASRLKQERNAKVFAVACSSPANAGRTMPFHVAGPMSSLDRDRMAPGALPDALIEVPVRTLDQLLAEAGAPRPIDLLSIDVEGHELDVLSGFDFARWRPRLVLLEDQVADLGKYKFMAAAGYRLVRHVNFNGWYVPAEAPMLAGPGDRWEILRNYWLALPFRVFRNATRRLRQPFKDRRAARRAGR